MRSKFGLCYFEICRVMVAWIGQLSKSQKAQLREPLVYGPKRVRSQNRPFAAGDLRSQDEATKPSRTPNITWDYSSLLFVAPTVLPTRRREYGTWQLPPPCRSRIKVAVS